MDEGPPAPLLDLAGAQPLRARPPRPGAAHCGQSRGIEGYGDATYGEGFADVYDDWYADVSDVEATVEKVAALADAIGGPVLELGVGTGRLAIPLADRGVEVHGVDASPAMLARLQANDVTRRVQAFLGPMEGAAPPGPFGVVFVAFNTFFNLVAPGAQDACMRSVAARLRPGGAFVVETFVPDDPPPVGTTSVDVKAVELDRVVLVATVQEAAGVVAGQHLELAEGGVRLRPWRVRVASPDELDAMAAAAGLQLESAEGGWRGEPFDDDSATRVAVYRRMHP